jgi:hypothetical protein
MRLAVYVKRAYGRSVSSGILPPHFHHGGFLCTQTKFAERSQRVYSGSNHQTNFPIATIFQP